MMQVPYNYIMQYGGIIIASVAFIVSTCLKLVRMHLKLVAIRCYCGDETLQCQQLILSNSYTVKINKCFKGGFH